MAAAAIAAFLLVVMIEVGRAAWQRFVHGGGPAVSGVSFAVMLATMAVNLGVTIYERRAGARLASEVLLADALHTRSDVLTSLTVIVALAGSALGYPVLDSIAAFVVVGFIGICRLADRAVDVQHPRRPRHDSRETRCARSSCRCPHVIGCHAIRTRGSADFVFLDLHIWMAPETPLDVAHAISHEVKDRLMARLPEIGDAIIHIEPPPRDGVTDSNRKLERIGELEKSEATRESSRRICVCSRPDPQRGSLGAALRREFVTNSSSGSSISSTLLCCR